jgi:hypothetical protein
LGGESIGYIETISCKSADIVPNECHKMGARSEKASRFFDSSSRADSRCSGLVNCTQAPKQQSKQNPAVVAEHTNYFSYLEDKRKQRWFKRLLPGERHFVITCTPYSGKTGKNGITGIAFCNGRIIWRSNVNMADLDVL